MILISCGSIEYAFGRLLNLGVRLADQYSNRQIWLQTGQNQFSSDAPNLHWQPYFKHQEFIQMLSQAEVIVAAAGETTAIQLLEHARVVPILFPRLKKFHEHVDDQQLLIAQAIEQKYPIKVATTTNQALRQVNHITTGQHPFRTVKAQSRCRLVQYLKSI